MNALETDQETYEQCFMAFNQLSGKLYVTEDDLKKAGLGEEDMSYLLEHLGTYDKKKVDAAEVSSLVDSIRS